jgi:hypothetical protein
MDIDVLSCHYFVASNRWSKISFFTTVGIDFKICVLNSTDLLLGTTVCSRVNGGKPGHFSNYSNGLSARQLELDSRHEILLYSVTCRLVPYLYCYLRKRSSLSFSSVRRNTVKNKDYYAEF